VFREVAKVEHDGQSVQTANREAALALLDSCELARVDLRLSGRVP
jgi:hypothetical protein